MTHVALVTGGSRGLGRALTDGLVAAGWHVVTDGRHADALAAAARPWADSVTAIPGDLTDAAHRDQLVAAVRRLGRLDLLVHNAGVLGPASGSTRRRELVDVRPDDLQHVWRHNVGAPIVLTGLFLTDLAASGGTLLSISSDAALEHYEGWGLYGASKAALDHLTMTFAAENPGIRAYAVDPGDMRTRMHQEWFPGEDISDRPLPETVVPHLLALLERRPPSGRYRAADIAVAVPAAG
ncbi:SDR family NAD(P)-dependent oxidoreductase [Nocardioides kongjuensis]|uniref:NAD(P)-dependent dehydrogenase (Short-subunit alcohol dehydrogenase family) n=1 Tax=Nocardioides kongjuensis TaxID=349522 RepID=A0A852RA03_9ACTN|nr:SDR family NAD(P)-dependent oxidoreductase [Nocardioides kongjuensis]NYD29887.1 NAD(P)-dependent dehydrogenase (short-subunit alcohol dehydrogenase family) [Nocardioides kongjuensis]